MLLRLIEPLTEPDSRTLVGRCIKLSLQRGLATPRLGTYIPQNIPLPVQAGDEHGPPVLFATWLIIGNDRRFILDRGYVAQGLAETTVAELVGAAKELN